MAVVRAAVDDRGGRRLDGRVDDWRGETSRIGGTTQVSKGEVVYQDHLFDDLGADIPGQRPPQHGTVGNPKGKYRYPEDTPERRFMHNSADIQELRLARQGGDIWLLARFSTLLQDDSTVIAFAFDTDGDAGTGGGVWPRGAGVSATGADIVATLWGTGGSITSLADGAETPFHDVAVSTVDNSIEARLPLAALGGMHAVRVWAASGIWDPAAQTWMAPMYSNAALSPARAMNVGFRATETGSFMEEQQAAALATGDITPFVANIDLDAKDALFSVSPGHFYDVILDDGFAIEPEHEGVSYDGKPGRFPGVGGAALTQHFDFFGRYQPYGLYVPSTYDGVTVQPAALVLHGLGGSFSSYNSQPGFLRDMGEGLGNNGEHFAPMFLLTPLARGSSFYADWGEAETMAVLRDVESSFAPIDTERVYLTGYSMGGYGVYRFASIHPDLFAAAATWAGYTGEFTGSWVTAPVASGARGKAGIGDPVDTLENVRSLPLLHLTGTNDEIVPTAGQYAAARRLQELGYESRWDLYAGYEHFSFALVDDWKQVRSWLGDRHRVTNPRTVDYRFSDGWTDASADVAALGLVHDGAYWLHGLTMR
ncbi:MAG: hypothetical protein V7636_1140, partial [Actinomycetota bacterium]